MSFHFSAALVAAYSEACCSDGEPSAPSSTSPTPSLYSSSDRMMGFFRRSQSGMTCEPLTADRGAALLTWYLAAFPASRSAWPENRKQTPMSGTSGLRPSASLAKYDRSSRSWRTSQHCLALTAQTNENTLDEYSETWPKSGTMRSGQCWERTIAELRTDESECGYWLTPAATNISARSAASWENRKAYQIASGRSTVTAGGLAEQVQYGRVTNTWRKATTNQTMYPPPQARGWKGTPGMSLTGKNPDGTVRDQMDRLAGAVYGGTQTPPTGSLNPAWVEWLMGWPIGWTDLKPLATGRFHAWLRLHGVNSTRESE